VDLLFQYGWKKLKNGTEIGKACAERISL